jgi:hypothetical protein
MRVDQWQHLRIALGPHAACMVCKNSHLLPYMSNTHMCHGATCMIGVSSMEDMHRVYTLTQEYGYSIVLIGGYWNHQCRSYQDVMHICTLPSHTTLHTMFLQCLSPVSHLNTTLQSSSYECVNTLTTSQMRLYHVLCMYANTHGTCDTRSLYCLYIN